LMFSKPKWISPLYVMPSPPSATNIPRGSLDSSCKCKS
jgi:hypothetical protein